MDLADPGPWRRMGAVAALACAVAVVAAYADWALSLLRYPWDWSPDEGLWLDYATRILRAPETLYPHGVVPYPDTYGPVLPILLVPIVAAAAAPLFWARLLAAAWTAAAIVAAYRLVRRSASWPPALLAAVLVLAPGSISLWYLFVRVDGLLVALWLWAAHVLLPVRLTRGGDSLAWPRAVTGASLLLAAALTKPTGLLLAAPLVLGWAWVDLQSARRLATAAILGGACALSALVYFSQGGYLSTLGIWSSHPMSWTVLRNQLSFLVGAFWPIHLLLLASLVAARRRLLPPEPSLLLLAGGLAALAGVAKVGAGANHLLPLLASLPVVAARLTPAATRRGFETGWLFAASAAVLVFLATQQLPRPRESARVTADFFYGSVQRSGGEGRRLFVLGPQYANFVLGQPAEADATFAFSVDARREGTSAVLERLRSGRYEAALVFPWFIPPEGPLTEALASGYELRLACGLTYFFGSMPVHWMSPPGRTFDLTPPPEAACASGSGG